MMDLSSFSNTIWTNRRMFGPKTKGSMAITLKLSVPDNTRHLLDAFFVKNGRTCVVLRRQSATLLPALGMCKHLALQ